MGQATVPWQVPAAKKSVKNPVAVSPAVIEKGKSLYITHCKSCHGDPGKGNGLPLVPKPTDPASDKYQGQTDGEMFFKIQTGRGAMPKFAEVISDNDKWSIIHFVRSLKKKSSAGAGEIILDTLPADLSVASASLSGQPITLKLKYRDSDTSLIATLTIVNEEGETVPAPGVPVAFFIRRYFGNLPISEEVDHTNQEGRVGVSIPRNLPGDTSGMLHIFARIAEPDKFGAASDSIDAICGKPSVMVNITEERTLWGRSRVAPLYIIITFFGALLIVWGTMGYVVMNVMKIAKKEA
ncbi:MAG: hypothetical protein A2X11_00815 [Bacteroidetes bacterium GWE2_42_24]|nr:MAG: hypothetical protein A2X11_00815 [Bacteroidetes bacterium GWE2_42_24]OFY27495.1 MAG: hypothetical protein A2X09_07410 [Bacteroidetes bacterium GWF2_43_11]